MTQANKIENFQLGANVINTAITTHKQYGVVVEGAKVRFDAPVDGGKFKTYTVKLSDKWQLADAPAPVAETPTETPADAPKESETANDPARQETAPKTPKSSVKAETDKPAPVDPLTDEQRAELKKYVSDFIKLENEKDNKTFLQSEILDNVRAGKLFRETHSTFGDWAKETFSITREYAQLLAQIGAFYKVSKDFIGKQKLSVNCVIKLVQNQNKLAESMNLSETELKDFAPVLQKVIETTISAGTVKGKTNITPRIVNAVADVVSEKVKAIQGKTGADLINAAADILGQQKADILDKTKQSLNDKGSNGKGAGNGSGSRTNDTPGVYAGALSGLIVECTNHGQTRVLSIGTGTLQTKCLCRFKMIGFDLVPFEIDGKRAKVSTTEEIDAYKTEIAQRLETRRAEAIEVDKVLIQNASGFNA